jgi:hypothetical protein
MPSSFDSEQTMKTENSGGENYPVTIEFGNVPFN